MCKLEGSQVAGVYGRDQTKAADFAKRHGISKVFKSVDELINDPFVDIVYIATPPDTHKEYAFAALTAGKHVYVEKPMGPNYTECVAMQQLADAQNCKLFVAHYRRGLPYFAKVKSLLPMIGMVVSVKMELNQTPKPEDYSPSLPWRLRADQSGGGYFYDLAPHGLDIIQFLVDDPIQDANGFATNRAGLYEVADTVVASFKTKSGLLGTANWNFATGADSTKDELTIIGTAGEISCAVFTFSPIRFISKGLVETFQTENPTHIQAPFIQSILHELRGNDKALCTGNEALPTAWAMDRIMGKI